MDLRTCGIPQVLYPFRLFFAMNMLATGACLQVPTSSTPAQENRLDSTRSVPRDLVLSHID
jgi:hypothetical protein